jgi:signal transduction histidine kinase/ligand-binding sensor domain-containing protein
LSGLPNAVTQTQDGYLWIGTEAGLVRFDGVRFVPWAEPEGKHLPAPNIYSLLGAKDGSLWIGTGRGIAHWANNELTTYPSVRGRINSIQEDQSGTIWMARSRLTGQVGPLCGVEGSKIQCYGPADGLACSNGAQDVALDEQGNHWIGGSDALCRWKPDSSSTYLQKELKVTTGLIGVSAIAPGDDGIVWIGIPRPDKKFGLRQLMNGVSRSYAVPGMDGATLAVVTLFLDRNKALWIGTESQGIYRVYNGKADHFSSSDGLSSNSVQKFYQDREGNVWVVTSKGIDCFRDLRVATFSVREGLTADSVGAVLGVRDGALWIGSRGGLDILRKSTSAKMTARDGLPGQNITSLLEDHAGRLWIGVDRDLAVYDHKQFRLIKRADGSPAGVIVAMAEDADHDVWASYTRVAGKPPGLLRIRDFEVMESIPLPLGAGAPALAPDREAGIWLGLRPGGLERYRDGSFESFSTSRDSSQDAVSNLLVDTDGTVWGATDHGLVWWKGHKAATLNSKNGLPCDSVYALIKDNLGSLWLATKCGFVTIPGAEIAKWQKQTDGIVKVKTFDIFDGAQPARTSFRPSVSKSLDGRLWFANDIFVQMVDPSHLETNNLPPPVHIEEIVADRKNYAPGDKVSLPPLTRDLEIDYTALSFVVPHKVRFRYKLEGRDTDWQDPMTRRQAFYSDLRPGNYRFRVIACNNDGVWNKEGATLNFSIAPAWYQTTWFRVLCFAAVLALVWILYRVRMHQVAKAMSARFDERLSERIRMARELHDTFLQTIQASKMVAEDGFEDPSDTERMHSALGRVSIWLARAVEESRAALNSLRSSTTVKNELGPALRRAAESAIVPEGMTISVSIIGDARELHPIVRDELYRIGNEAVQNAKNHSHGSRLSIDLTYGQDLTLHVGDNGVGIDPGYATSGREGHHGLQGMRERAARIRGRLTILSSAESGTDISVIVPGNVSFLHTDNGILANLRKLYRRVAGDHETL